MTKRRIEFTHVALDGASPGFHLSDDDLQEILTALRNNRRSGDDSVSARLYYAFEGAVRKLGHHRL